MQFATRPGTRQAPRELHIGTRGLSKTTKLLWLFYSKIDNIFIKIL
jgi:hypothetical protein